MQAELVDGAGRAVKLKELIDRDFKTLIIFIRHFQSGYSQRYIERLSKIANGELVPAPAHRQNPQDVSSLSKRSALADGQDERQAGHWIRANGVKVVVIGNGNYQLIDSYRTILNCPFPIYTDLSKDQKVYKLLGMQKLKDVKLLQQAPQQQHPPASFHIHPLAYPALPGGAKIASMWYCLKEYLVMSQII
ncbi:hypothetical protein PtA15_11A569 [Puccinia triticina]|uniref:Uncharacterized protein n=1 Tax=Puccinia triticina TaxID=208348 RepID=A0ABY7D4M3_9BASI|nr:uncharacterized protein PtA15_11A569 [Puccinia triticina]WAQ89877.1 hypothetical protein PtA15_11A569 [Puccinia triticina]